MSLVDSHCHLDFEKFDGDLDAVLERAVAADVKTIVAIGTSLKRFDRVLKIAEANEDIFCTVGVHPHEAGKEPDADAERLLSYADHPKIIGFGESGLDYYYNHSSQDQQRTRFRSHVMAARVSGLPLVVHTRDAEDDTIDILSEERRGGGLSGLIHCFSGTARLAEQALSLGFYISVSGVVTFNRAQELRDVVANVPLDRLLVETDAPYLAPVPYRGKRNEPSYIVKTAAKLAEIKGVSPAEIEAVTSENFFRLFRKATKPR
ncbi:TatD-related deoxyribonuclease [Alphaproteobacteria bacterium]|nr:TatD-related deoxyribonuclease [Alphaproteobacteria bacterium]